MRVLIVKLSSMGDLIHALPALTDASQALPGIEFDWVVDEAFAEIPAFHPNVKRIIKSAHRRWGRNKWEVLVSGELKQFLKTLRKERYDLVLDAQNNLKSAFITRFCRGLRCGMSKQSVREYGAHFAYQRHISMADHTKEHAITRQRTLFAKALGYTLPTTEPTFTIDRISLPKLSFELNKPYIVFIHSTTWQSKHWPFSYWERLIQYATNDGYYVVLPWGSTKEEERAKCLSQVARDQTIVPPFLSIREKASLIDGAKGVVTVDTGLAHLTAALRTPAVHLYGATDPNLLAIRNPKQQFLFAEYACSPCYSRQCQFGNEAACFQKILPPEKVWETFKTHLTKFS